MSFIASHQVVSGLEMRSVVSSNNRNSENGFRHSTARFWMGATALCDRLPKISDEAPDQPIHSRTAPNLQEKRGFLGHTEQMIERQITSRFALLKSISHPAAKLRFLQYIDLKTADWWPDHRTSGAVLLGKSAKALGLTAI